ncbi:AMP-binding protein [Streptomyces sp. NPDC055681]
MPQIRIAVDLAYQPSTWWTHVSSTPALSTVPRLLAEAAARYEDHPAVVDGDTRVGYRQLAELVQRTARAYAAQSVQPEDRVAIWAFRTGSN